MEKTMENKGTAMLSKLTSYIRLEENDDGTTRGKYARLVKADFTTSDAWDLYKFYLATASVQLARSLRESNDADSNKYRNDAMDWINKAYYILAQELYSGKADAPALYIAKRNFKAWIATGTFARARCNFKTAERDVVMRSWTLIARMVEADVSDILNGRPRLEQVRNNSAVENAINKYNDKQAKKAAEAEKNAK